MDRERWRQIEELYHSARENGRGALAGVAPDLRREVERLLDQDSEGKILDQPAAEIVEASIVTQLAAGTQVGPYRIEARLGAGGMGEVYRGTDTRLRRFVALKFLSCEFARHPDALNRFRREAPP